MMRVWLLALAAAMASHPATAAGIPSADELKTALAQHGAKAVVGNLVKTQAWDGVSDRIASGRPEWLALVPVLATGTDAGPSEDLGIDLASALPKNAAGVLQIADEKAWQDGGIIGVERICGVPFVQDTEPKSYVRRTQRAVRAVSDPALAHKKQVCLATLRRAGRR